LRSLLFKYKLDYELIAVFQIGVEKDLEINSILVSEEKCSDAIL